MAISSLEAIPVAVDVRPLAAGGIAPYRSSGAVVDRVERLLVRLRTDGGVTGWGECRPERGVEATVAAIEETIAPAVEGLDVWATERVRREAIYAEYTSPAPLVAATTTAMLDAYGRSTGEPLHRLLGGATRDRIAVADVLGILDPEESGLYAERAVERGYDVLKTKAGTDWRRAVDRLVAMDDAVEGALAFRLDPNGAWTADEAVRAGAALEAASVPLQYLEQPLRTATPGAYAALRSRLRTPIAVNEDTYHEGNLARLLERDAVDVAVADLVPAGGIRAFREQAAMAAAGGCGVTHHSGFDLGVKTAAMVQTVAATPAVTLPPDCTYQHWTEDVLVEPLTVVDGCIELPDGPGLGVAVSADRLERYRID